MTLMENTQAGGVVRVPESEGDRLLQGPPHGDLAARGRAGGERAYAGDVSQFIMGLTQADTVKPGHAILPGHEDDPVFAAAFPSSILSRLPCLSEARAS